MILNDAVILTAVCRLAVDPGPCRDAYNRWYFDPELNTCQPFVFRGCAGNMNRFKNFQSCIDFCSAPIRIKGPFYSIFLSFFFLFDY